jgi:hypothetical protein
MCNSEDLTAPIICPKGYWRYNNGFNDVLSIENDLGKLLDFIDPSSGLYAEYMNYYSQKGIGTLTFPSTRSDYLIENESSDCIMCPPGYYCERGSVKPTPCPIETFCEHESSEPTICKKGYYNNQTSQYKCTPCEPGRVCLLDSLHETSPCPAGYICPSSSIGSLDSNVTVVEFSSAKPCPASEYCPIGSIDAGIPCPAGNFCPEGSSMPTQCYPGTFQNSAGMAECYQCPTGYYCSKSNMKTPTKCDAGNICNSTGLIMPTILCPEGYICPKNTGSYPGIPPLPKDWIYQNPILCPKGRFCYPGTKSEESVNGDYTTPQLCTIGEYNPDKGQGKCKPCEAGYECTEKGMTTEKECSKGTYRPNDPGQINCLPCPDGTYGYREGLADIKDCETCPAGVVCIAYGLTIDNFLDSKYSQ